MVSNVKVGLCKDDLTSSSICGDIDDRVPSTDVRMGRIGGCTGWLISEDVFIQAGHCGTPSSSTRIHFVYGTGSATPENQYAVDVSSYQGVNGGVGNDWGAGRLLPNSVTGKLPGVAQSEKCGSPGCGWFNLGDVPTSTSGNNIRITGYGTADVDSRSQKTHVGALTTIGGTYIRYVPDTTVSSSDIIIAELFFCSFLLTLYTSNYSLSSLFQYVYISLQGGNSGSPVVHEETGLAIGVHTHGGCSATGGSNQGTRIDKPEFKAHVDSLLAPCTQDSDCDDGVFCNGAEMCNAGKCMAGDPPSCDDGFGCTIDICNEATQTCEHEPKCGQNDVCIEPTGECECSGSDKRIEVDILTDNYPAETTWTVTDKCGASGVVLSGGPYDGSDTNTAFSKSVCATAGQYEFKIDVSALFRPFALTFSQNCYSMFGFLSRCRTPTAMVYVVDMVQGVIASSMVVQRLLVVEHSCLLKRNHSDQLVQVALPLLRLQILPLLSLHHQLQIPLRYQPTLQHQIPQYHQPHCLRSYQQTFRRLFRLYNQLQCLRCHQQMLRQHFRQLQ